MLLPWMSRVARSKPLPCISSSISAPATARPLSSTQRQRRYSSSKPSSPSNDGSRPISAPTEAPTKGATPSVRKRASSKVGRPRSKDGLAKSVTASQVYDLPSVPSTQHLNRQDVHIASFFSLYRPISVVSPVPSTSTSKAFSSIFKPRQANKPRSTDVLYTLSSAVQTLDKVVGQSEPLSSSEANLQAEAKQAVQASGDPIHLDGQPIFVSMEELAKNFQPFVPPPPPVPMDDTAQAFEEPSISTVLSSLLELPTKTDPFPAPRQPFLERMRTRQETWNAVLEKRRITWQAISVKRQRKLKMKKHKYKKLMRRTRNLRRRQDRL